MTNQASINTQHKDPPATWLGNYLPMWIGQALSLVGSALVQFALVWYVTKETGSATVLATATTAALVPNIVLGPFVGALVDRWDRKLVMIFADLAVALATAVLAVLFAFGLIQLWHIYIILFIRSMGGIFQSPARTASISLMVPKDQLTRLGGINQALDGLISIFSPALGALLLELLPIQWVLAVDFITAVIAIGLLIFFVKVPKPRTIKETELITPKTLLKDVREGFQYIFSWPGLFIIIMTASVLNLFLAPASNLLPLYVTQYFKKGAQELAWLQASMGIGAIVGGALLGFWGGFKRKIFTVMSGIIGIGIGMISLSMIPASNYFLSLFAAGLVGTTASIANGSLGPLMQSKVPSEIQGRIFTVLSSLSLGMMPVGLFLSAPIVEHFNIQTAYLISGAACLLIGLLSLMDKRVVTFDAQLPGGQLAEESLESSPLNTAD